MPHEGAQAPDLTGQAVGGVDRTKSPAEFHVMNVDPSGNLMVAGGSGMGNAAAGPTGAPVPADGDYIAINVGGNLVGVSAANPLPVTGTITPASVNQGNQGTAAEGWFVELTDGINVLGTSTHPLRIDPTGTTVQPTSDAADGATGVNVPADAIYVGAINNTGKLTGLSVNASGYLEVTMENSTVAVTQSTSPWIVAGGLTNNNAAPSTNNVGVLPAIAESAYTNLTYTSGDQVLPATDLHGALMSDLEAVAGVALGATAVVNYGSTPAAVAVPAVNAFITNTPAVTVSGTVAVTQSTSPWVVSLASTTITGTVTAQGNLTNNNAAPNAFNLGVLPAIANAAAPSWTEGDQVLLSEDLKGNLRVNTPVSSTAGACALTSVTSTSSAILASNTSRKEVIIVNTDVVTVYIGLGQTPTATAYHIALSPCTTAHDGTGGVYISDIFQGAINAIVASTSGHCVVTELT